MLQAVFLFVRDNKESVSRETLLLTKFNKQQDFIHGSRLSQSRTDCGNFTAERRMFKRNIEIPIVYRRPSQVMGIVLFVGRIKLKSAVSKILIHIRMQCLCDGVGQNGSAVLD